MCLTLVGLTLCTADLIGQTTEPNPEPTAEDKLASAAQDIKIQQLQDQLEEIQKELIQLKQDRSAAPETHHFTTAKASVAAPIHPIRTRSRLLLPTSPGSTAMRARKTLRMPPNSSHRKYVLM